MGGDGNGPASWRGPSSLEALDVAVALQGKRAPLRWASEPLRVQPAWLGRAAYPVRAGSVRGQLLDEECLRTAADTFLLSKRLVASDGERPVRIGVRFGEACDLLYAVKEETQQKLRMAQRTHEREAQNNARARSPLTPHLVVATAQRVYQFVPLLRADLFDAFVHLEAVDSATGMGGVASDPAACRAAAVRPAGSLLAALAEHCFIELVPQLARQHAAGVPHADIKAENVLIGEGADLFFGDFGDCPTAVNAADGHAAASPKGGTRFVVGAFGTEGMGPPELFFSAAMRPPPYDHRGGKTRHYDACAADVWALGATVLGLLSPNPLFPNRWFCTAAWQRFDLATRSRLFSQSSAVHAGYGDAFAVTAGGGGPVRTARLLDADSATQMRRRDEISLANAIAPSTPQPLLRRVMHQQVAEQLAGLDEVVPTWGHVLRQMLHADPRKRPSAEELMKATDFLRERRPPEREARLRRALHTVPALYADATALVFHFDDWFGSHRAERNRRETDRLGFAPTRAWLPTLSPSPVVAAATARRERVFGLSRPPGQRGSGRTVPSALQVFARSVPRNGRGGQGPSRDVPGPKSRVAGLSQIQPG